MTLRELLDQQADDAGLWFDAPTASEAYLQQELRRLHAAIEAQEVKRLLDAGEIREIAEQIFDLGMSAQLVSDPKKLYEGFMKAASLSQKIVALSQDLQS